MARVLVILIAALVVEAVGVTLLSRGLKQIGGSDKSSARGVAQVVARALTNSNVLLGIALETVFFAALIYLLSQRDVSLIWPLTALGFVLTALAARFILREDVSWVRWTGVMLIVVGAALVSYSELLKTPPTPGSATATGVAGEK